MKRRIVIDDSLDERVQNAIDETRSAVLEWYDEHPDESDEPCDLSDDLDDDGALSEIVDGCVPAYNAEISDIYHQNQLDLDEAYENAGIGDGTEENHLQIAIYCYIEQAVAEWYDERTAEDIRCAWRTANIDKWLDHGDVIEAIRERISDDPSGLFRAIVEPDTGALTAIPAASYDELKDVGRSIPTSDAYAPCALEDAALEALSAQVLASLAEDGRALAKGENEENEEDESNDDTKRAKAYAEIAHPYFKRVVDALPYFSHLRHDAERGPDALDDKLTDNLSPISYPLDFLLESMIERAKAGQGYDWKTEDDFREFRLKQINGLMADVMEFAQAFGYARDIDRLRDACGGGEDDVLDDLMRRSGIVWECECGSFNGESEAKCEECGKDKPENSEADE